MEKEQINQLLDKQRQYFYSGATLDLDFRISALKRLRASIRKHEDQIHAALKKDLGKSNFESYMCETGLVLSEITHMLKNIALTQKKKPYQLRWHSSTPAVSANHLPMASFSL